MDVNNKGLPLYTISTAAELLGISIHTLRMYEREGLVLPFKKDSGHRLYSAEDIDRIICIRKAINESKISIAGIRTIYSLIPCWKLLNCPEEHREKCESYNSHAKPCWTFQHNGNVCATNDCKKCTVYMNYSECSKIKESITHC